MGMLYLGNQKICPFIYDNQGGGGGGAAALPAIAFPGVYSDNDGIVYAGGINYADLDTALSAVDTTSVGYIGDIIIPDADSQTATTYTLPGTWSSLRGFRMQKDILRIPTLTTLDLSGIGTILSPLNVSSIDTSDYSNPKTIDAGGRYISGQTSAFAVTTISLSNFDVTASINVSGTNYYGGNLNYMFDVTYYDMTSYQQMSALKNVASIDMRNMDFTKLYFYKGSGWGNSMNDTIFCTREQDYSTGTFVYASRFASGCTIYVKDNTQRNWILNNYSEIASDINVVVAS